MAEPYFHLAPPRRETTGVALVLHGGRANSHHPVTARQLTVVRMRPFISSLAAHGDAHGLAVARVRYAVRGWNGAARSPVGDVLGALDRITAAYPGVPVALVGHSMGGRTAVHVAGHPAVTTVVGLAPWLEASDPVRQLADRDVLVAHGAGDHTTSPKASARMVRAIQGLARSAAFVRVEHEGHALLRRAGLWHDLATGYTLARLCDVPPAETTRPEATNVLEKVLAGSVEVDV